MLTLRGSSGPRRGSDLRNLGIIQDGAVLIVDGFIREVGPTRRLENLAHARGAQEIDASGRVILPGFVDSHTHLVGGQARLVDYERDSAPDRTKGHQSRPAIGRAMRDTPVHILVARASRVLDDGIRQGTTTIEAKSGSGITQNGELKILRTHASLNEDYGNVVSTFLAGAHMLPNHEVDSTGYLNWLCDVMLPLVKRRRLATFADVICEKGKFSVPHARQYLAKARELGFGLKIHATDAETVRLALEAKVISVDHCVPLDTDVTGQLAASTAVATLLPGPVFHRGREDYPSARNLINRGAAVALATDFGPETSPAHNMQMILSLACTKMHMTPAEAIAAATINAAHALGLAATVGSIETGKHADLIMLDISDYRELIHHFGSNPVTATMKKGRVIYRASEVQWPVTD